MTHDGSDPAWMRQRWEQDNQDMKSGSQVHLVVIAISCVLLTVLAILVYNVGDR